MLNVRVLRGMLLSRHIGLNSPLHLNTRWMGGSSPTSLFNVYPVAVGGKGFAGPASAVGGTSTAISSIGSAIATAGGVPIGDNVVGVSLASAVGTSGPCSVSGGAPLSLGSEALLVSPLGVFAVLALSESVGLAGMVATTPRGAGAQRLPAPCVHP